MAVYFDSATRFASGRIATSLENTTSLSLWFCNQKSCERTRCTLVGVAKKEPGAGFISLRAANPSSSRFEQEVQTDFLAFVNANV